MDLYVFVSTMVTLLVILDPPGLLPIFLAITRKMKRVERNKVALEASFVSLVVIGAFALFGRQILDYLHVTMPALQVSGGLLLLLIALDLLQGKDGGEEEAAAESSVNVAIVPIGIPLLAGPGAIVAMMVAVQDATDTPRVLAVGLALIAAMVGVYVFLRFAGELRRVLGEAGITLATRIAGMLLAAIAVQMCSDGVFGLIRLAA